MAAVNVGTRTAICHELVRVITMRHHAGLERGVGMAPGLELLMEVTTVPSFLRYFENIRNRTNRVVDTIPPERIEWAPRPGQFTFGDVIRHLACTERFMFAENAQGNPSRYPGHGPELAQGFDAVRSFLNRMHVESVEIFARLTDDDLRRKCETPAGTPITVWKWLRAMLEHEIHHRGQIYLMLGILEVTTPPLYGLTAEQVQERSVR